MIPSQTYHEHLGFVLQTVAAYDSEGVESVRQILSRFMAELDRRDEDVSDGLEAIRALRKLSGFLSHTERCSWTQETDSVCSCGLLSALDDYPNVWLAPSTRWRLSRKTGNL